MTGNKRMCEHKVENSTLHLVQITKRGVSAEVSMTILQETLTNRIVLPQHPCIYTLESPSYWIKHFLRFKTFLVCQLAWAKGYPDSWQNTISSCVFKCVSGRDCHRICGLSTEDCSHPHRWHHSIYQGPEWNERQRKGRFTLSSWAELFCHQRAFLAFGPSN